MPIRRRSGIIIGVVVVAVAAVVTTIVVRTVGHNSTDTAGGNSTVTWWVPDWDAKQGATLVNQFQSENPGIKVSIVQTTGATVKDRVSVALNAGGDVPDVVTESIARTKTYASKNQLADLSSLYDSNMPKSDFAPGLVDAVTTNGATYSVPYRWATNALIYNPTLFKAAGIAAAPTTWAEFEADAKKLTSGNVVGTAWPLKGEPNDAVLRFLDFAISDGATINNGTPKLDEKSVQSSLDLIGGSVVQGWASKSSFELDNTGIAALFLQGRVGMYLGGVFDVDAATAKNAPIATAQLPGPSGVGTAQGVGWNYIIPAASKNQDAAKKFVTFLARPDNEATLTLTFPARISAGKNARFQTPERKPFANQLASHSVPAPNNPKWTAMVQFVHDQIELTALGKSSSASAAAAIMQQATTNLGS